MSLPETSDRAGWLGAAAVSAGAFAIYLVSAGTEPAFGDGLELVAAAAVNGVPHPTGYPLLTLILGPFAHGEFAYAKCMAVCAAFAAGAAFLCTRLLQRLLAGCEEPRLRHFPIFAGAVIALSSSLWMAATVVEVYALNALLLSGLLLLLLPNHQTPLGNGKLAGALFLQGLALSNHLSSACLFPLLAWRCVQHARARRWRTVLLLPAGVAGLLAYAVLPLRAMRTPPINWGDVRTLEGFRWLITGGDYRQFWYMQEMPGVPFTPETYIAFFIERLVDLTGWYGSLATGELGPGQPTWFWLLCLGAGIGMFALTAWGAVQIWRRSRALAVTLGAATVLQLFFVFTYNIRDIRDYYLGVGVTLLPFLALGVHGALQRAVVALEYDLHPERMKRLAIAGGLLVLIALGSNWKPAGRAGDPVVSVWISRALHALPPNAIVMTHSDLDIYPLWYAQHAQGRRPDVLIAGANFLRNSWYETMVPAKAPDAHGRQVHVQPGSFRNFDQNQHAQLLREAVIEPNLGKVPVYTTNGDGVVLPILAEQYRFEVRAVLLSAEASQDMTDRGMLTPPPVLLEILPRRGKGTATP